MSLRDKIKQTEENMMLFCIIPKTMFGMSGLGRI